MWWCSEVWNMQGGLRGWRPREGCCCKSLLLTGYSPQGARVRHDQSRRACMYIMDDDYLLYSKSTDLRSYSHLKSIFPAAPRLDLTKYLGTMAGPKWTHRRLHWACRCCLRLCVGSGRDLRGGNTEGGTFHGRKHCEKRNRGGKTKSESVQSTAVQRGECQEGTGHTRQGQGAQGGVGNGGEQQARSGRTLEAMGGVRGFWAGSGTLGLWRRKLRQICKGLGRGGERGQSVRLTT